MAVLQQAQQKTVFWQKMPLTWVILLKLRSICFWFSVFQTEAQALKQLEVEETSETSPRVFTECNSPDLGVLVFRTAITGLNIELNMPSRLRSTIYNKERNEYILCVDPTDRQYWVTISGGGFEAVDIEVKAIRANDPRFFRINPKEQPRLVTDNDRSAKENFDLGEINFGRKDYVAAVGYYRKAVELQPSNAEYLHKLGNTLLVQGSHAQAEGPLLRAVNIRPNNAELNYLLGHAYFGQSKYTLAANSYKKAVDLEPNNRTYNNDLQKAIAANPERAKANFDIGNSYLAQGKYTDAQKYFNDAVKADPHNNTYKTQVNRTETIIKQQQHMNAAAEAFRRAENQKGWEKTTKSDGTSTYTKKASTADLAKLFKEPLNHVAKAQALGSLKPEWQESARYYEAEHQKYKSRDSALTTLGVIGLGGLVGAALLVDTEEDESSQ